MTKEKIPDVNRNLVFLLVLAILAITSLLLAILILQIHLIVSHDQSPCIQPMSSLQERESNTKVEEFDPVNCDDYDKWAAEHMDRSAYLYVNDGATTELTLRDNVEAFWNYKVMPDYLVNVINASSDTSTTVLGKPVSMPVGIAPAASQLWVWPLGGEISSCSAAQAKDTIFIASAYSSISIEDIAEAVPAARKWQQIYLFGLREYSIEFAQRSQDAGFEAIVVTIDRPVTGLRYNAMRGLHSIPDDIPYANFRNDSVDLQKQLLNPAQDWAELEWFRTQTEMPIILKGMLNPDDVERAIDIGVQGIIVSNHGARVLDGVPATIDVLESIVEAAAGRVEIYVDGGIRSGLDIFKALALGARMVFIGRPMMYSLGHSGQEGVEHVLRLLQREFGNTMGLSGANSVQDINRSMVFKT